MLFRIRLAVIVCVFLSIATGRPTLTNRQQKRMQQMLSLAGIIVQNVQYMAPLHTVAVDPSFEMVDPDHVNYEKLLENLLHAQAPSVDQHVLGK